MKKIKSKAGLLLCTVGILFLTFLFVPSQKAEAAGNYYLQVNKGTNVVTVFNNNGTPVRSFICSVGYDTPVGTFYTSQKLRWHVLMGPSYGQYCTRITGSILFHSVFYNVQGDLSSMPYSAYNKLGSTASHGCVRLTVADAKWIYENCPLHTKVVIINGNSNNDPLGKPEAIKVNTGAKTGWDPTDPAPGNPYASAKPWINVSGAKTNVAYKSKFSPGTGIIAYDSLGNDISHKLTYTGKVNTKKLGSYKITYSITDALGRSANAQVTYKVVDNKKAVIKGVKKSMTKEYGYKLNLRKNVKASTVTGKNLTKKIKVKIIYPNTKKEKTYKSKTIQLTKLGTYKINYYVTNPNNKKVTKVTCKVKVQDTKAPVISGVTTQRTEEYQTVTNLGAQVKAKTRSGKDATSSLVIKVKVPGSSSYTKLNAQKYSSYQFQKVGTYEVEYSAANPYNKKAVAKVYSVINVVDTQAPQLNGIVDEKTVQIGSSVDLRSGITAGLPSGQDLTSAIAITVKNPQGAASTVSGSTYVFDQMGVYDVTYAVQNPSSQAAAAKNMRITVQDGRTAQIVIQGDKSLSAIVNQPYDIFAGVTAQLSDGTPITDIAVQISGTDAGGQPIAAPQIVNNQVSFTTAGTYTITYQAQNSNLPGSMVQQSITVTVTN